MRRPLVVVLAAALIVPAPMTADSDAVMKPAPAASYQAAGQGDIWDSLPDLPRGTRVQLLLTNGSEIRGRLISARSDAIVLEKNQVRRGTFAPPPGTSLRDALTFKRSDVSSVVQIKGWPTWAKALVWVGIGWVAAGAIIGSIVGNS